MEFEARIHQKLGQSFLIWKIYFLYKSEFLPGVHHHIPPLYPSVPIDFTKITLDSSTCETA